MTRSSGTNPETANSETAMIGAIARITALGTEVRPVAVTVRERARAAMQALRRIFRAPKGR